VNRAGILSRARRGSCGGVLPLWCADFLGRTELSSLFPNIAYTHYRLMMPQPELVD